MAGFSTRKMVLLGLLTALVVVLQFLGAFIHLGPFSITLVLIPIVIGAASCGILSGAWLGFVFGIAVLISGDAAAFLVVNPYATILTVLLKGTLAGLVSGAVYGIFENKNRYFATTLAAFICPIVNTGVFLLGCFLFFMPTLSEWALAYGFEDAISYIIFGMIGLNFIVEMCVNIVLSPVATRLVDIWYKRIGK
jgi:uncharacterized membrane protein